MADLVSTDQRKPKILIWGLKNTRHSHRYIHAGFFANFQQMGYETNWVEDELKSREFLKPGTIVLAVNVASNFLVKKKNVSYVLHNINPIELELDSNFINLQVYTSGARGVTLGSDVLKWDSSTKTLFQPWGIPIPKNNWLEFSSGKGMREYWVGAIWQNHLGQGNKDAIREYRAALQSHRLTFSRIGGVRWFTRNGISEKRNLQLVNKSPLGASIVGTWQRENEYIPCRFFKNIAAGSAPISNSDMGSILGIQGIYSPNVAEVTEMALSYPLTRASELNRAAKKGIEIYSYKQAIHRILSCLD